MGDMGVDTGQSNASPNRHARLHGDSPPSVLHGFHVVYRLSRACVRLGVCTTTAALMGYLHLQKARRKLEEVCRSCEGFE